MVPIADDSTATSQATNPEMNPSMPVDPVRAAVHIILAIYLSPVILVVCLIGATSILAGRMLSLMKQVGNRGNRKKSSRPAQVGRLHGEKTGPRLIHRRERSQTTRRA